MGWNPHKPEEGCRGLNNFFTMIRVTTEFCRGDTNVHPGWSNDEGCNQIYHDHITTEEMHDSKEQKKKKKKRVLMDTLLDLYEQGGIDIEGIQEEINTFMFAGRSYLIRINFRADKFSRTFRF